MGRKSLAELDVRKKYGITVVGVMRGEKWIFLLIRRHTAGKCDPGSDRSK